MVENTPPDELGRLRPATTIALALLILAWTSWKLYKLYFFFEYGFFSWQFLGATFVGVLVFLGSLATILWAFQYPTRRDQ